MILADGMGGHQGGAAASRIAVSTFSEAFKTMSGTIEERLRNSLDAANAAIGRHADENTHCRGMGCTLVACVVTNDEVARWISVGDSPLWLLHAADGDGDRSIQRLNDDHSMKPVLEELVRLGRLSSEEAARGPAHQLRSALMGDELGLVDEGQRIPLSTGDRMIVASDGLETLSLAEIQRICERSSTATEAATELLTNVEAVGRRSQDNATVIIYRHSGAGAVRARFDRLTARTVRFNGPSIEENKPGANEDAPELFQTSEVPDEASEA